MRKAKLKWILIVTILVLSAFSLVMLAGCGNSNQNTAQAPAKKYPEKTITMLVWSAPGSALDIFGRTMAGILEKSLGQPVAVVNKTGGSGTQVLTELAAASPDGYTIATASAPLIFLFARKEIPMKPDDFTYLANIDTEPSSLMVKADSPYKTFEDFIQAAKAQAGKITVAGPGSGTFNNVLAIKIANQAGVQLKWIPYKGGNQAIAALLGGHVDAVLTPPSSALAQIGNKQVQVLVVSSAKRSKYFPDVPTLKEKGINLDEGTWRGFIAPKNLPKNIEETLEKAIAKAIETPEWKNYMEKNQQDDVMMLGDDFAKYVQDQFKSTEAILSKLSK
ncbi:MAG: tripartite tricarboxylate transporter substrate binding protein [Firmicutes bacterium]|nr:tripartite tricarboxylate transporter substrate binding protein [Bacillota bacterium]